MAIPPPLSFLSLTEGNIHLGSTVIIDKYEGWNNGETRLLAVLFIIKLLTNCGQFL